MQISGTFLALSATTDGGGKTPALLRRAMCAVLTLLACCSWSASRATPLGPDCVLTQERLAESDAPADPNRTVESYKSRFPNIGLSFTGKRVQATDRSGTVVGFIEFSISEKGRFLEISYAWTATQMRGQGLNTLLFARLLAQNPRVERISAMLAEENLAIFKNAVRGGMKPRDALMQTPAYRARKRFGFSEIVPEESYISAEAVALMVRRSAAVQ